MRRSSSCTTGRRDSGGVKERLGAFYHDVPYDNLLEDVGDGELMLSVAIARKAGIADKRILLDPGLGFGKSPAQNLELLDRLPELRDLGFPLLVGSSRKSFIGLTLGLPPEDRLEGTAATVAVAIARGADVVRVHDVKAMTRVARMTDAIVRRGSKDRRTYGQGDGIGPGRLRMVGDQGLAARRMQRVDAAVYQVGPRHQLHAPVARVAVGRWTHGHVPVSFR